MTLAQFKERLVEAHRCRLLELCRADLVERMNSKDVAESETRYLDGIFHVLRVDQHHHNQEVYFDESGSS